MLRFERERRWDEAVRGLERLIREDPGNSDYHLHLGFCEEQRGNLRAAVRSFRAGLALQPGAVWARMSLALCWYALGEFDAAAREWEALLDGEVHVDYLFNLGLTRLRQLRTEEGWSLIRAAADRGTASRGPAVSARGGALPHGHTDVLP